MQGLGFKVQGFRVHGLGSRVQGLGLGWGCGLGICVQLSAWKG